MVPMMMATIDAEATMMMTMKSCFLAGEITVFADGTSEFIRELFL